MDENPNGGKVEAKTTSDPRVVKMFRRLENFLDRELPDDQHAINFSNAETGRVFAVFMTPEAYEKLMEYTKKLVAAFEDTQDRLLSAEEQIEIMADDDTLLAIIDAQNEVLMGRVNPPGTVSISEEEYEDLKARMLGPDPRRGSWEFTGNDVAGDAGQFVSAQEYQELVNLRKTNSELLSITGRVWGALDSGRRITEEHIARSVGPIFWAEGWSAHDAVYKALALLRPAVEVRVAFTSDAIRD